MPATRADLIDPATIQVIASAIAADAELDEDALAASIAYALAEYLFPGIPCCEDGDA
jgi:hypothetical protein